GAFCQPGLGEKDPAHPPVFQSYASLDELLFFQRAQYPTQIARINSQAASQLPDFGALRSDFPKQPSLTDWTVPLQEPIVQSANALGHNSVEAPHLLNGAPVHFSDSSQRSSGCQLPPRGRDDLLLGEFALPMLRRKGWTINRKLVLRLVRENGWLVRRKQRKKLAAVP